MAAPAVDPAKAHLLGDYTARATIDQVPGGLPVAAAIQATATYGTDPSAVVVPVNPAAAHRPTSAEEAAKLAAGTIAHNTAVDHFRKRAREFNLAPPVVWESDWYTTELRDESHQVVELGKMKQQWRLLAHISYKYNILYVPAHTVQPVNGLLLEFQAMTLSPQQQDMTQGWPRLENAFVAYDGLRKWVHIAHIVKDALLIVLSIWLWTVSHGARIAALVLQLLDVIPALVAFYILYRKTNELNAATLALNMVAKEKLSLTAAYRNVRQVLPPGCRPTHHPFGTGSCLDMTIFEVVERKLLESREVPGETYWPYYVDPQDVTVASLATPPYHQIRQFKMIHIAQAVALIIGIIVSISMVFVAGSKSRTSGGVYYDGSGSS